MKGILPKILCGIAKPIYKIIDYRKVYAHYDRLCAKYSDRNTKKISYVTYTQADDSEDKKTDCFLVTDCIGTEKMVSSEYNSKVFRFANTALRKLLADIQIEEQNHAEMLYKYKTANGMA